MIKVEEFTCLDTLTSTASSSSSEINIGGFSSTAMKLKEIQQDEMKVYKSVVSERDTIHHVCLQMRAS